ncbi:MAG: hypothetical protein O2904_01840 [bacterium]|nr:hypothetical protein [bacterium]
MKKISTLLIGLLLAGTPLQTYAFHDLAVSDHYVQDVLDRANQGIANSQSAASVSDFHFVFFNWLSQLTGVFLELVDTKLRIVEYQRDLVNITACYHYDLILMEEEIELVRQEILTAFEEKRIGDIFRLQSLARFLNARYNQLIRGGTDPLYEDEYYHWLYSFDEDGWCCNKSEGLNCVLGDRVTCLQNKGNPLASWKSCEAHSCDKPDPEPEEQIMCPFHSDYLPPTGAGYGCDLGILNDIADGGRVYAVAERDGMAAFIDARDDFLNNVDYIRDITLAILTSLGRDTSDIQDRLDDFLKGRESERTHRTRIGCNRFDGDVLEAARIDTDTPNEFPKGAARIALRGPFNLSKNEPALLHGLFYQLRAWGALREQADYLKFPNEYIDGSTEFTDAEARESILGSSKSFIRWFMRDYFKRWNIEQMGEEATAIMQSTDAQLQITTMLKPLRTVMRDFSRYASKQEVGARKFTRGLGWYLRRSCIYRTCTKQLDHILKINFKDVCFPYTDGSFVGNPTHHEMCRSAAKVTEGIE